MQRPRLISISSLGASSTMVDGTPGLDFRLLREGEPPVAADPFVSIITFSSIAAFSAILPTFENHNVVLLGCNQLLCRTRYNDEEQSWQVSHRNQTTPNNYLLLTFSSPVELLFYVGYFPRTRTPNRGKLGKNPGKVGTGESGDLDRTTHNKN